MAHRGMPRPYDRIYAVICQVPSGQVSTYGQIARIADCSARQVGYALAALKSSGGRDVPWQRVINRQGRISLAGEGESIQRQLLEAEGVEFDADARVDFERFGWDGPDLAWLEQNGFNLPF